MRRRQGWLFFILFLLAFSIYLLVNFPFQLGLDLKGGTQLTIEVLKEDSKVNKEELEAVKAVLDRRVNNLGVSDSNLVTLGSNQIILELPGEEDFSEEAERIIEKTALLEFRIQLPNTSEELIQLQNQRQDVNNLINLLNSTSNRILGENIALNVNDALQKIEEITGYESNKDDLYSRLNDQRIYINKEIAKLFINTDLTGKD